MKTFSRILLCLLSCFIFLLLGSLPSLAAKTVVLRYGLFERSLPVADIRSYGEKQQVSDTLQSFLSYLDRGQQQELQAALQVKLSLDLAALNQLIDTQIGQEVLHIFSDTIARSDDAGIKALQSAVLLGASSPEGLSIVSFIEAYPSNRLVVNASKLAKLQQKMMSGDKQPGDHLSASPIWQMEVQYQVLATQGKQYSGCLFGDSISAELGNTLGQDTFNFGLDGLSAISLVEELQQLTPAKVKCQKAVIAVGGNDAWYGLSDELFSQKLQEAITLIRATGTKQIFLIPAFYSTVAASLDPTISAPLPKVERINTLIDQVSTQENTPVMADGIAPLYDKNVLKQNLAAPDGDHLNEAGLKIYREALLQIFGK